MNKDSKIFVAGHDGMVGSALVSMLKNKGYHNILTRKHHTLDLTIQKKVNSFFREERPEYVFDAAAKVGGISANDNFRAQFIYENLMIQNNLIHSAFKMGVKKFLFLGSSCIYPKYAPQPMKEDCLLTGTLEPTNEPYAIAKIAGIKMCENYFRQYGANFISVMPTNLYGPNDNFNLETSHVLPALIRKLYEAKISKNRDVILWGTGNPKREFLFIDDMASACIHIMETVDAKQLYDEFRLSHINIGTGEDLSINDLAVMISKIVGFFGKLSFDDSMPDGTPRKLLDVSLIQRLGWHHNIGLEDGIRKTYEWYLSTDHLRK
jgi:GDP-L-fucose synthase